jgi:hypothetical protein
MGLADLTHQLQVWTHGPRGFALACACVAIFSLLGLEEGKADFRRYMVWPITRAVTFAVTGLVGEGVFWAIEHGLGRPFPHEEGPVDRPRLPRSSCKERAAWLILLDRSIAEVARPTSPCLARMVAGGDTPTRLALTAWS